MGADGRLRVIDHFVDDAGNLFVHCLIAVYPCAHFDGGGNSGCTHAMHFLVAGLDCRHNLIPLAFDIGAISMKRVLKPPFLKNTLALCNLR